MRTFAFVVLLATCSAAACGGKSTDAPAAPDEGAGGQAGAAGDAAADAVEDPPATDAASDVASASCSLGSSSTLPGVTIELTSTKCTFTLAEAAAGIALDYRIVVASDLADVVPLPGDAGSCASPGPSGLITFERLSGGAQQYCLCDVGLCPPPTPTPVTLKAGSYPATFSWDGRNWSGPSDTGNPKGPPFPVGEYALSVTSKGTAPGGSPFAVEASFRVTLVP